MTSSTTGTRSDPAHAADRLLAAIDRIRAPVCVGLDPVVDRLPDAYRRLIESGQSIGTVLGEFCCAVIDAVADIVPCVKVQSACFERYHQHGLHGLTRTIAHARSRGLQVIHDAKRGDIGISAEHYAAAAFDPASEVDSDSTPDWITINSYLGDDGIRPFLRPGCGAFALVRTSNPGGDAIQSLELRDGRTVAQAVAELIARIGKDTIGERGYSSLGAVVGATKRDNAFSLRRIMPQQIFLVPGFGAQGGSVDDILPCFNADGAGAIITASRSVIYAFDPNSSDWQSVVSRAASAFADGIGRALAIR